VGRHAYGVMRDGGWCVWGAGKWPGNCFAGVGFGVVDWERWQLDGIVSRVCMAGMAGVDCRGVVWRANSDRTMDFDQF
jgi:hypothetical protein